MLKNCEHFRKGLPSWIISSFLIRTSFVDGLLPYTSGLGDAFMSPVSFQIWDIWKERLLMYPGIVRRNEDSHRGPQTVKPFIKFNLMAYCESELDPLPLCLLTLSIIPLYTFFLIYIFYFVLYVLCERLLSVASLTSGTCRSNDGEFFLQSFVMRRHRIAFFLSESFLTVVY